MTEDRCQNSKSAIEMDSYQNILQKTYDKKIPFVVHWELTYRCNLSCIHCYATNRNEGGELTISEVEYILDQLGEAGSLFLNFTGGEIFCRDDLIQVLLAAKVRGFAFRLLTNGTLLSPKLADRVAEIGPLAVEFSLYAMKPAVHDRITGVSGSHEKTLSAIRLCVERRLNTAIKSVFLKYNVSEYGALSAFARDVGARFVFDYMLIPADDGTRPMDKHGLSEQELFEFIFALARPEKGVMTKPGISDPLCGAGCNSLAITPLGDVFPCLAIRQRVGNLRKRTLKEIRASSSLDKFRNLRYCDLQECSECSLARYCIRCSGVALAESGNTLGCSESACMAARATKRAIKGLTEREVAQ